MSFRYPVPDEEQEKILIRNGIDPGGKIVIKSSEEYLMVQQHTTGDEIVIRRNPCKRKGAQT